MSAACLETSEPEMPMAIPMSAFLRAGESFTPSPVTATMAPCRAKEGGLMVDDAPHPPPQFAELRGIEPPYFWLQSPIRRPGQ